MCDLGNTEDEDDPCEPWTLTKPVLFLMKIKIHVKVTSTSLIYCIN